MLTPVPVIYRKRKPRPKATKQSSAPLVLNLIAANYSPNDALVSLVFNQPISIASFDPAQIILKDGLYAQQILQGTSTFTQTAPDAVELSLEQTDYYDSPEAVLDASGSTGIISESSGVNWAGVTGFPVTTV